MIDKERRQAALWIEAITGLCGCDHTCKSATCPGREARAWAWQVLLEESPTLNKTPKQPRKE